MYFSQNATYLVGVVLTVFFSYVIAFEDNEDQTLKLKLGFDLTQEINGAPSLRRRNYEDSKSRKLNSNKKKSDRADSSSDSDEAEDNKEDEAEKAVRDSDLSEDVESSGSDGYRQLSTKGLIPEESDPAPRVQDHKSKVHEKYEEEDSE